MNAFTEKKEYLEGDVTELEESEALRGTAKEEAMVRQMKEVFAAYALFHPKNGTALERHIQSIADLGRLLDQITINMPLHFESKQMVLSAVDIEERYEVLMGILTREIEIAGFKKEFSEKIKHRVDKRRRSICFGNSFSIFGKSW